MTSFIFAKMALRNLRQNTKRSLATAMAITSGFVGLCLLGAYILRTEAFLRTAAVYLNHSGHIAIYKKDGLELFTTRPKKYILTLEERNQVNNLLKKYEDQIDWVAPFLNGMGLISDGGRAVPFAASGVEAAKMARIVSHPDVKKWAHEVTQVNSVQAMTTAEGISLTKDLGSLLGKFPPFENLSPQARNVQLSARTLTGDMNAVNAQVEFQHTTGMSLIEATSMMAPLTLLQQLYDTEGITYLAVFLKDRLKTQKLLSQLQSDFSTAGLQLEAIPYYEERLNLYYVGGMSFLKVMGAFFVFLIFAAILIAITNSLTMGIIERTKEIGTLRSMGFTGSQVQTMFVYESYWLSLLSILIGSLISLVIAQWVDWAHIIINPPGVAGQLQFLVNPPVWLFLVFALPLTLFCSLTARIVSRRKCNEKIVQLLLDSGR